MSRDFGDWRTVKQKVAMGEKVGRVEEFKSLQETACVHINEREDIAWCRVYQRLNPEDREFNEFLEETVIPALVELGRQRWYRDTLTDLSLALSVRKRKSIEEDVKDVLEEEIE